MSVRPSRMSVRTCSNGLVAFAFAVCGIFIGLGIGGLQLAGVARQFRIEIRDREQVAVIVWIVPVDDEAGLLPIGGDKDFLCHRCQKGLKTEVLEEPTVHHR